MTCTQQPCSCTHNAQPAPLLHAITIILFTNHSDQRSGGENCLYPQFLTARRPKLDYLDTHAGSAPFEHISRCICTSAISVPEWGEILYAGQC
jgi:hypothetical protein